ncbi:VIT1/CCC1 transporter family protein [Sediminibacterium soli]|uniref:VIT1/CCC1 transporter family protein n=1 Tax=Sediminibacterium soli TaxID=2698829 RepID=UPI00137AB469|nr:VIT family protein [Sediminibacterium soli]NCI46798.1 VIT family protein [Sediminibacterium soli]
MDAEKHYNIKSGWIRAAVLGANDGILSTSSLAIGIAAAGSARQPVVLAALAGIVAGALSMAAGEYVSVSSQSDIEQSDLAREKQELAAMPEAELEELAAIYRNRGLDESLAKQVAIQLTAHDALAAHARDELGINEITQARPMQAAFASGASFICGGVLPLLVALFAPLPQMVISQYVFAIGFMALSAFVAAKAGGSPAGKAVTRICFWGTVAMGVTALVGYLFGVQTA